MGAWGYVTCYKHSINGLWDIIFPQRTEVGKNHCTIMLDVRNMVEGLNFSFVLMGQAWEIIKFKYSWM